MVERDLFQDQGGGSIPTSSLQLTFERCTIDVAVKLNMAWHSRVPKIGNANVCFAYCAKFDGKYYAIAMWSAPIARLFNDKGYLELRRMAICADAPKFTASRMIAWMTKDIKKTRPDIVKLISYQDCHVHKGTIYKACRWVPAYYRERGREKAWTNRKGRIAQTQTTEKLNSAKMRWEKDLQ